MAEQRAEDLHELLETMSKTMQDMIKKNRRILSLIQLKQAEKAREEFFAEEMRRQSDAEDAEE